MAHYAKLDDTNTVIDVLVVDDAQEAENGVAWMGSTNARPNCKYRNTTIL